LNPHVKQLLYSGLAGVMFMSGAFLVSAGKDAFDSWGKHSYIAKVEHLPEFIRVLSSAQDPSTTYLTIRGKFQNTSNQSYNFVGLYADFTVRGKRINVCEGGSRGKLVEPNEVRDYEITCLDMDRGPLPDGVEYKIGVSYAEFKSQIN